MTQLKRKVTLRHKQTESPSSPSGSNPKPKPRKWLWLIPAAIVIAGGALIVANLGGKDDDIQVAKADVPKPENSDAAFSDVTPVGELEVSSPIDNDESTADETTAKNDSESTPEKFNTSSNAPETGVPNVSTTPTPAKPASKANAPTTPKTNNEAKSTSTMASLSTSIEENALRVVRGEFGNGKARKEALGDRYTEIQSRVNEMYREDRFN